MNFELKCHYKDAINLAFKCNLNVYNNRLYNHQMVPMDSKLYLIGSYFNFQALNEMMQGEVGS